MRPRQNSQGEVILSEGNCEYDDEDDDDDDNATEEQNPVIKCLRDTLTPCCASVATHKPAGK